jgi:transcriptional regulator of acetoin/glycerol metabolism
VTNPFSPGERVPGTVLANPLAAIPRLRAAWETYQEQGVTSDPIRPEIAKSWSRSREHAVSPDRRAADVEATLGGLESRDQLHRLILHAWSRTRTQLSDALSGSDSAVVVCDDHGRILDRGGDASILRATEAQNFVPGSLWSEEGAGTNGIGLALALARPAQVFSAEHFCVGFQDYACTAAPVRHPVTRGVIGVLDVTTRASILNPHTFAMVVHASRYMEREMEDQVFGRERELLERYLRGRVGLHLPFFTVDRSGRTIIQNAAAAQMLQGHDLSAILVLVRDALRTGRQVETDLELTAGRVGISCHAVHAYDEVIGAVVSLRPLRRRHASSPSSTLLGWHPIVGRSPAIRELLHRAERVARTGVAAVVEGEPGSGKLTLARAMHARSARVDETLAIVNFANRAWREELAEATTGTAVFVRLAALSESQQLELASRVESLHEAGVWTLALVTPGDRPLRLELLHRLGHTRLRVPPLRERIEDVSLIVADWCRRQGSAAGRPVIVSATALDALRRYDWPGNVRELLNTLEAARLENPRHAIERGDLVLPHGNARRPELPRGRLRDVERAAIEQALAQTGGNVSRAADLLGIGRATLYRRLREYRLLGY